MFSKRGSNDTIRDMTKRKPPKTDARGVVANFKGIKGMTPEERFWPKVDKSGDCWIWTACTRPAGYGHFTMNRKLHYAHRVAYEFTVGAIPDGMYLDHICHNKACVKPEHLRAVTNKQNQENLSGAHHDSATGIRGVFRARNVWRAQVTHRGKSVYLGTYATAEEAEIAVIAKRNELFTHNDSDRADA